MCSTVLPVQGVWAATAGGQHRIVLVNSGALEVDVALAALPGAAAGTVAAVGIYAAPSLPAVGNQTLRVPADLAISHASHVFGRQPLSLPPWSIAALEY